MKKPTATGFEPVRANPTDNTKRKFESVALTTRPNFNMLVDRIFRSFAGLFTCHICASFQDQA